MIQKFFKSETGQTAIEYLLLLVVSFALGVAFYKKMNEYLLTSPNSIISRNLKSLGNKIQSSPGYKTFRVVK